MIAGIDEAGKGCVIGSLFVAGVCCDERTIKIFEDLGVRDSKKLSHSKRVELAEEIRRISSVEILRVDAKSLNELMRYKTLNEILRDCYVELISKLKPKLVYVDCPDVKPDRFSKFIESATGVKVIAEHKADEKYVIVSAASIIAKVEREREIQMLKEIYGDFGSGYASDSKTRKFLNEIIKSGKIPDIVRKKWKTIAKLSQRSLNDFIH